MIVRKHYYVSGRVQGVGFRYRAQNVANAYGLTGYAINLYDGRVELEVQGEAHFVQTFLDKVEETSRFICIDNIESYDMNIEETERKFYID